LVPGAWLGLVTRPTIMPNDYKSDDMGMGAGDETPSQGSAPEQDSGDQHTVMLSADHFPGGMEPKKGDKLTFCCTADPDSEGNVSGYFEKSGGADDSDDWANDFRKQMSARTGGDEGAE
jgi:hypothetical protein